MVKKLITTKCELLVSPETSITATPGLVYLEFLMGENIDSMENAQISSIPELFKYDLDDDGLYMYYRLAIFTKERLGENCTDKLYYDESKDKLMLGNEEVNSSVQLEKIVDKIETEYAIIEFVEEPVFSICRLTHCLSEYQRKFVLEGCSEDTRCKSTDTFAREFLFSTVFVLRQLIRQQRYGEALRILKSVEGCNGLCSNTKSSTKKCNCCR